MLCCSPTLPEVPCSQWQTSFTKPYIGLFIFKGQFRCQHIGQHLLFKVISKVNDSLRRVKEEGSWRKGKQRDTIIATEKLSRERVYTGCTVPPTVNPIGPRTSPRPATPLSDEAEISSCGTTLPPTVKPIGPKTSPSPPMPLSDVAEISSFGFWVLAEGLLTALHCTALRQDECFIVLEEFRLNTLTDFVCKGHMDFIVRKTTRKGKVRFR